MYGMVWPSRRLLAGAAFMCSMNAKISWEQALLAKQSKLGDGRYPNIC